MSWIPGDDTAPISLTDVPDTITPEIHRAKKRAKRQAPNTIPVADMEFLNSFLSSLATVPSHYCRASRGDTKFLEPGTTMTALYDEYVNNANEAGNRIVSYPIFSRVFHEGNYSVFVPRKDQCDVCISAKHGAISEDELLEHTQQKTKARDCKKADKVLAEKNPQISCWTMDMQAVMLSPKTQASCMYYKTKLQLHNFTLFCLDTHEGYCYAWDECNGDLSSDMFAWLQYQHFKEFLEKNRAITTLIIWSDGCGYQNRNATLSNMYIYLAKEMKITIIQKYLIPGHTKMECDSMHSMIERKITGPIYCPRDYVVLMQAARRNPNPYHVKQLDFNHFMTGFQDAFLSSIRPGKKAGDPTVHDLRALRYTESGIDFKLHFDDEFVPIPQRMKSMITVVLEPMFTGKLPLTKRKYNDLQSLKHVLPEDLHQFYDNLPHHA